MTYDQFIQSKLVKYQDSGFDVDIESLNGKLFAWQRQIVKWALAKGKCAIFADCGLGKTAMQLEWAHQVHIKTGKPVLIIAPLAVSAQTILEGVKFGIEVVNVKDESIIPIKITNYEQLEHINQEDYSGVVLDESSILKNYTGQTKRLLIEMFECHEYKLACTATPSPNDINEIGNHSEFLSIMDSADMAPLS